MPLDLPRVPASLDELRLSGRIPGVVGQRCGAGTAGDARKVRHRTRRKAEGRDHGLLKDREALLFHYFRNVQV